ncbi:DUF2868 domain-containing protein [Ectopseudomonas mendocina]|uniref:DUF2868 domain-containing protein n=1 Tax=Ectopseudomonas mendocina TaxID=300 RepID=UPI0023EC47DB|nr:DUF2868 domain-containing protein [Pseudomonas mendocina]
MPDNRPDAATPDLTAFDRLWLCEAVRLTEAHGGLLDDAEANRRAIAAGGSLARRIEARALWLAERDGLIEALRQWRRALRLAALALLLLAVLAGVSLAFGALGDGRRPVNVFWALGSLLGLHLLSLLAWLAAQLLLRDKGAALGRLWLWLSERLARDARVAHLGAALASLLQRRRLEPWLFGLATHALWLTALSSALVMLLIMLSARHYGFLWETTLLGPDAFVGLTQALGSLPGLLGFSVPAPEQVVASGASVPTDDLARRAWAGWLIGVLVVYGLLPRALLALYCLWHWQRGRARLSLDENAADYAPLRERLQPSSEVLGIWDPAPASLPHVHAGQSDTGHGALMVAIELDEDIAWPPALPSGVTDAGVLDSREQRRQLLEQLTRFPPQRLAIVCDPRRSPDRGTLALIAELSRCAAQTRIWLLQPAAGRALDAERLQDWHDALSGLGLPFADSAPLHWLEHGHD